MSDHSKLIWEKGAINDLFELREFLKPKNPKAAANAARCIIAAANSLLDQPYLGHPIDDMPEFYKLSIPFGKYGYVLKYHFDNTNVVILRIWHGRQERNI